MMALSLFLMCACACTVASEFRGFSKDRVIHREVVHLHITHQDGPDQGLHVRFSVQRRPILLRLVRQYSSEDLKGPSLYFDRRHNAVISVRSVSRNSMELTGTFLTNQKSYYLQPTTTTTAMEMFGGESVPHRIMQIRRVESQYDKPRDIHGNTRRLATRQGRRYKRKVSPQRTSISTLSATAELVFVVDVAAYSRWVSLMGLEKSSKANWAVEMVYTLHADGVNERFRSLTSNNFSFNVTVGAIHLIQETRLEYWSTYHRNGSYDGAESLRKFTEWVNVELNNIIPADHYILVTGHNMSINNTESGGTFASMCSNLSTSIVEDSIDFIIQTHIAHRIAQSIGATLDGVQNSCRDNGNVMSPGIFPRVEAEAHQPWWFSGCTAGEIETILRNMTNSSGDTHGSTCLQPSLGDARYTWHDTYPLPGINVSGDSQCKASHGAGYFVCRARYAYDYTSICTGLYCCDNIAGSRAKLIIPADGTPCWNQHFCRYGTCVKAPSYLSPIVDTCVFGDHPGNITGPFGTARCQHIVKQRPAVCYNTTIELACCTSCDRVRIHTLSADCKFGDEGDCDYVHAGYQCYDDDTLLECCDTCDVYRTTVNGCSFGDKNDTVCGEIELIDCYHGPTQDLCCQTCHDGRKDNPDCPFGDKRSTCTAERCSTYDADILNACCKTCDEEVRSTSGSSTVSYTTITSSPSGCPYEDEVSNCVSTECSTYGQEKQRKCCSTCPTVSTKWPQTSTTTWSSMETTSALASKSSNLTAAIAASVGGFVIVGIIVVIAVCWIRRHRNNPKHLSPIDDVMYNEYKLSSKANKRAPVPQPRDSVEKKPRPLERQDTGMYAYIRPEEVASIPRHDSNKTTDDKKGRGSSDPLPPVPGDYLELKLVDNYGYMEAVDKSKKGDTYNEVFEDKSTTDQYNHVYDEKVKKEQISEPNDIQKPANEYVKLQNGQDRDSHKYGWNNNSYVNERF